MEDDYNPPFLEDCGSILRWEYGHEESQKNKETALWSCRSSFGNAVALGMVRNEHSDTAQPLAGSS